MVAQPASFFATSGELAATPQTDLDRRPQSEPSDAVRLRIANSIRDMIQSRAHNALGQRRAKSIRFYWLRRGLIEGPEVDCRSEQRSEPIGLAPLAISGLVWRAATHNSNVGKLKQRRARIQFPTRITFESYHTIPWAIESYFAPVRPSVCLISCY